MDRMVVISPATLDFALRGIRARACCRGLPYQAARVPCEAARDFLCTEFGLALDSGTCGSHWASQDVYHRHKGRRPLLEYASYRVLGPNGAEATLLEELWLQLAVEGPVAGGCC